jgi:hypothetical protein
VEAERNGWRKIRVREAEAPAAADDSSPLGKWALAGAFGMPFHPLTVDLVRRFTAALLLKLRAAEEKYGYGADWAHDGWTPDEIRADLAKHMAKGDPRDVAIYSAFLWHRNESTAAAVTEAIHPEIRKLIDATCGLTDGEMTALCASIASALDGITSQAPPAQVPEFRYFIETEVSWHEPSPGIWRVRSGEAATWSVDGVSFIAREDRPSFNSLKSSNCYVECDSTGTPLPASPPLPEGVPALEGEFAAYLLRLAEDYAEYLDGTGDEISARHIRKHVKSGLAEAVPLDDAGEVMGIKLVVDPSMSPNTGRMSDGTEVRIVEEPLKQPSGRITP